MILIVNFFPVLFFHITKLPKSNLLEIHCITTIISLCILESVSDKKDFDILIRDMDLTRPPPF